MSTTTALAPSQQAVISAALASIGESLIQIASVLSPAPKVDDDRPTPLAPLLHRKGKISHATRMRMQERALGQVEAQGGSMSRTAFAQWATRMCGYGRGYSQFYAGGHERDRLLLLSDDRKTVHLTSRGTARLAYARDFLAEYDAVS